MRRRRAHATDRRAKRVYITDRGYEVIRLMIAEASEVNQRVMSDCTPEEVQICEQVLLRAKKQLKSMLVEQSHPGMPVEKSEL